MLINKTLHQQVMSIQIHNPSDVHLVVNYMYGDSAQHRIDSSPNSSGIRDTPSSPRSSDRICNRKGSKLPDRRTTKQKTEDGCRLDNSGKRRKLTERGISPSDEHEPNAISPNVLQDITNLPQDVGNPIQPGRH